MQILTSGPDSQWAAIRQLYALMVVSARQHVYIQSPFFLPDANLAEALTEAALSGIDVKVVVSARPWGNRLPDWAGHTFIEEIVKAGVRVFLYDKGYLHAKTISIDRKSARSAQQTSISAASASTTSSMRYSTASKSPKNWKRTSSAISPIARHSIPRNIASAAPWRASGIRLQDSCRHCCDVCS